MQLTIQKRQGQNQYYEELLAEGCCPLEMMLIPAGVLLMGSPEDELKRIDREVPQHQVTLSQFFMARYPVTQAQWQVVAAMPQIERELDPSPANFKGELLPVEEVSWYDAVELCARLSAHTHGARVLPAYRSRVGICLPCRDKDSISLW